jgi:hypothetical protein
MVRRRHIVAAFLVATATAVVPAGIAAADANPSGTGQPSQSCQSQPDMPPGFSTAGFAHAALVYAGSAPQNSNNPNSVAQYDVACFQVSQH